MHHHPNRCITIVLSQWITLFLLLFYISPCARGDVTYMERLIVVDKNSVFCATPVEGVFCTIPGVGDYNETMVSLLDSPCSNGTVVETLAPFTSLEFLYSEWDCADPEQEWVFVRTRSNVQGYHRVFDPLVTSCRIACTITEGASMLSSLYSPTTKNIQIRVWPGTYDNENVVIDRDVVLIGYYPDIAPQNRSQHQRVIVLNSDNSSLPVIRVTSASSITMAGLDFANSARNPVLLSGDVHEFTLCNSSSVNTTSPFVNTGAGGLPVIFGAIEHSGSRMNHSYYGNLIADWIPNQAGENHAIELGLSDLIAHQNISIIGNTFRHGNASVIPGAIYAAGVLDLSIVNNVFEGISDVAVYLTHGYARVSIADNIFKNVSVGILMESSSVENGEQQASGNDTTSPSLQVPMPSADISIRNNQFLDVRKRAIALRASSSYAAAPVRDVSIHNNTISTRISILSDESSGQSTSLLSLKFLTQATNSSVVNKTACALLYIDGDRCENGPVVISKNEVVIHRDISLSEHNQPIPSVHGIRIVGISNMSVEIVQNILDARNAGSLETAEVASSGIYVVSRDARYGSASFYNITCYVNTITGWDNAIAVVDRIDMVYGGLLKDVNNASSFTITRNNLYSNLHYNILASPRNETHFQSTNESIPLADDENTILAVYNYWGPNITTCPQLRQTLLGNIVNATLVSTAAISVLEYPTVPFPPTKDLCQTNTTDEDNGGDGGEFGSLIPHDPLEDYKWLILLLMTLLLITVSSTMVMSDYYRDKQILARDIVTPQYSQNNYENEPLYQPYITSNINHPHQAHRRNPVSYDTQ